MNTTTVSNPVTFTEGAVKEIKKLMTAPGFDHSQFLRLGVKGGGCSGMSYILGFDAKADGDRAFEVEGIPCIINKSHELHLIGIEIDWSDSIDNRGFIFSNS